LKGFEINEKIGGLASKEEQEHRRLSLRPWTMWKCPCTSAQPQRSNVRITANRVFRALSERGRPRVSWICEICIICG